MDNTDDLLLTFIKSRDAYNELNTVFCNRNTYRSAWLPECFRFDSFQLRPGWEAEDLWEVVPNGLLCELMVRLH